MTFLKMSIYKSELLTMHIFIPLSVRLCTSFLADGFICDVKLTIDKKSSLFSHLLENYSIYYSVVVREYFKFVYSDS